MAVQSGVIEKVDICCVGEGGWIVEVIWFV